ncbi:hypothetical protein MMC12_002401 [Toensbergia leucococca]|nr:hypothetical protein [Toensbergia leucococca]
MPSASPTPLLSHPPHKPFSISLASKSKFTPKASVQSLNPKKRPRSSFADSEDSDEESKAQPLLVSAFDHSAGGAIGINGVEKPKAALVINGPKNRDWQEESRRKKGKSLLPAEVQATRAGEPVSSKEMEIMRESPQAYGLTFVNTEMKDASGDAIMRSKTLKLEVREHQVGKMKTEDDEALEALIGDGKNKSDLVLPAVVTDEGDMWNGRAAGVGSNEDYAFRTDVASRPDPTSLDGYAAVPVEEFGAALLRGMGWKEGDVVGKRKNQVAKLRVLEKRPALLGLGAKEVPLDVTDEPGAWGKATRGKRKIDLPYNPVLLKNATTGETLTEEELERKKKDQARQEEDWRKRRDKNLEIDEDRKNGRKHRDKKRSHSESRHNSSRRERSRSSESRHHSRRTANDDYNYEKRSSSRRERSKSSERRRHSLRTDLDDGNGGHGSRRRDRDFRPRDESGSLRDDYRHNDDDEYTRRRKKPDSA